MVPLAVAIKVSYTLSRHIIPSDKKFLKIFCQFIFQYALDADFSAKEASDIKTAFKEAVNNIIDHAYKGDSKKTIKLELRLLPLKLEIYIRDFGEKVKKEELKSNDLSSYNKDGLAVYLIENLMDYVHYDTTRSEGTLLKMIKSR